MSAMTIVGALLLVLGLLLMLMYRKQAKPGARRRARVNRARRSMLIGGVGLTIVGAVMLGGLNGHCGMPGTRTPYTRTAPQPAMLVTGPHTWQIDNKPHFIESSYWLVTRSGLQFTINYPWSGDHSALDNAKATTIALPLMKYAYRRGLYNKIRVSKFGTGEQPVQRIGVALLRPEGGGGYRVTMTVAELANMTAAP